MQRHFCLMFSKQFLIIFYFALLFLFVLLCRCLYVCIERHTHTQTYKNSKIKNVKISETDIHMHKDYQDLYNALTSILQKFKIIKWQNKCTYFHLLKIFKKAYKFLNFTKVKNFLETYYKRTETDGLSLENRYFLKH